jgi:hypothetical protein
MLGLTYSPSEKRLIFPGAVTPNDTRNVQSNFGMLGCAGTELPTDQKEVWADMFMSWVLDGYPTPVNCNGGRPGWQCHETLGVGADTNSSFATLRLVYTHAAMSHVLRDGRIADSDSFLNSVSSVTQVLRSPCG